MLLPGHQRPLEHGAPCVLTAKPTDSLRAPVTPLGDERGVSEQLPTEQ